MRPTPRRRPPVLTAGDRARAAAPARATDGSLYGFGVETLVAQAVPDGQCSVAQTGASFGVTCPPIGTSLTGTKWQIDLRTPLPGSVIEAFSWRAVRFHQTADLDRPAGARRRRARLAGGRGGHPRSPVPAEGLPGRHAGADRLACGSRRPRPASSRTGCGPSSIRRSSFATSRAGRALDRGTGGWVTVDQARVDVAGVRQLRLGRDRPTADQRRRTHALRAAPGRGLTSPRLNLAAVPDGVQTLRLEVDGDGTAGAGLPGRHPSGRSHAAGGERRPRSACPAASCA